MKRTFVIGIGNRQRGDDAAGPDVVSRLAGRLPAHVEIIEHDGEMASLLVLFEQASALYLVDACVSGAPPGTVRRFDVAAGSLPQEMIGVSTHGLGLSEAIEMARTLGLLPARSVVYAIEGQSFAPGMSLTLDVAKAVIDTSQQLRLEILNLDMEKATDA
ncbi:hydrogenase maturation protease [Modicisalibacter xianhensis]|uniref:Hydrogenase maturation protease n=1 Tax=Modicisalibacter xianhensis TaxID=442341 RepID=A0A4R8FW60_9GAMM|nr:hydrogenase maturation protease [Halomonas xianhensis]TDX31098.1 hydrogenase maturation protease [Halomonas xianhensis]